MNKAILVAFAVVAAVIGLDQYQDSMQKHELANLIREDWELRDRIAFLERENARMEQELNKGIQAVRREADAAVRRVAAASDTQQLRDEVAALSADMDELNEFVAALDSAGLGTAQSLSSLRSDVDGLEREVFGTFGRVSSFADSRIDDLVENAHSHCSGAFC